ncbi:Zn-dependent amino- or carboxypeptidase, M28 family [Geosmithia morbida]|uniref:Peptide hydrolase n=1 Tax=Geosmithia morbida TaxID=1094350 RepID=A0A9P4YMV8_9HYPO|nr:Zn-dependent amino- or carboxypeptidase, M28 family [Geosmithia morbida]KAF4119382.1 Zn-dependent amino- or carboxypeptidase, M28 family [Geosmithia morbida]
MRFNSIASTGLLVSLSSNPSASIANSLILHEPRLENILWNFNKIAVDNGGNRAFGLPGYNASLDFILERVVGRFGDKFDTFVQPFTHLFATTHNISLTGPDGKEVKAVTLQYNNPTPLPDGVTAALVNVPIDDERGSGCFEDQWAGLNVEKKIALVKRGSCAIADKLRIAKGKGAVGAVLINNVAGPNISSATLSGENYGDLAPVAVVTLEQGTGWWDQVQANQTVEVKLVVDATAEDRETWQVISETKEGDANNVIMVGAHLDSVQAGPGVNDDGSGSAALLEIAASVSKYTGYHNKLRFAWWGAEESGLVGSLYYVSQLSEAELDAIRFYFNYDMIGSPEPFFHIYADTDAHKTGGQILFDYLEEQGRDVQYGSFGSSSDYLGFIEAGIPSSGIFTGAGAPQDPCYHTACDDIDNVDWAALTVNTKAAGRALASLALDASRVPPRDKTSVNPASRRGVARSLTKWKRVALGLDKRHSCARDRKSTI